MTTATAPETIPSTQLATRVLDKVPPEVQRAIDSAKAMAKHSLAIVIDGPAMYQVAADQLVEFRNTYKEIEAQRVFLKAPFLEGCRRIDALFGEPAKVVEDAGNELKARMLVFQRAEDAKAAEAQRLADEAARAERDALQAQQAAAAERQRLADEEAARIRAEAQARADEERAQAERDAKALRDAGEHEMADAAAAAGAAAQAEADRAAREADERAAAERLAAQQQAEDAQTALDLAELAPQLPVVKSAAVAAGVSTRKTWKLASVDKAALVAAAGKALADGDEDKAAQLLAYLVVDETALNRVAGALKGAARVPGCVFHEVANLAATGRGKL